MELQDAQIWLEQVKKGKLADPETCNAIEEVLGALYEYEKYIDLAATLAYDYDGYYDKDTKMGDLEGLACVIDDMAKLLNYARGTEKPTNLEKWKIQQAKYCLGMDSGDFREFLNYNDDNECEYCEFYKDGACGLTEEQHENYIGCIDGIEEWCAKEVE